MKWIKLSLAVLFCLAVLSPDHPGQRFPYPFPMVVITGLAMIFMVYVLLTLVELTFHAIAKGAQQHRELPVRAGHVARGLWRRGRSRATATLSKLEDEGR